jgi:hypothetical protein
MYRKDLKDRKRGGLGDRNGNKKATKLATETATKPVETLKNKQPVREARIEKSKK